MCHCSKMQWEIYMSDQTTTKSVISLNTQGQDKVWTKWDRYNMK